MFKKILTTSLLLATVAGAALATTGSAQAGNGQNGAFALGAVGGLLVGSALASNAYGYGYSEPRHVVTYYEEPSCYIVHKKVWTSYGWRYRDVRICD